MVFTGYAYFVQFRWQDPPSELFSISTWILIPELPRNSLVLSQFSNPSYPILCLHAELLLTSQWCGWFSHSVGLSLSHIKMFLLILFRSLSPQKNSKFLSPLTNILSNIQLFFIRLTCHLINKIKSININYFKLKASIFYPPCYFWGQLPALVLILIPLGHFWDFAPSLLLFPLQISLRTQCHFSIQSISPSDTPFFSFSTKCLEKSITLNFLLHNVSHLLLQHLHSTFLQLSPLRWIYYDQCHETLDHRFC